MRLSKTRSTSRSRSWRLPSRSAGWRWCSRTCAFRPSATRVATLEQEAALQLDSLKTSGCERTYTDRSTGALASGLSSPALDHLRERDTLVVWRLDRLGRSLRHLVDTVGALEERGVGFRSLTEPIDTTTPGGRLVFHVFAGRVRARPDPRAHPGRPFGRPRARPRRWAPVCHERRQARRSTDHVRLARAHDGEDRRGARGEPSDALSPPGRGAPSQDFDDPWRVARRRAAVYLASPVATCRRVRGPSRRSRDEPLTCARRNS